MKKTSLILAFALFFGACTSQVDPLPDQDLPPKDEVVNDKITYSEVELALIAIDPNAEGSVGCGDNVELVTRELEGSGIVDKVKSALEELFSMHEQNYGESGLYNALYQSDLTIPGVVWDGSTLSISLSGAISSGGVCDDPRIEAQIMETIVANAPEGAVVMVTIDGKDLHEYFNLSGN